MSIPEELRAWGVEPGYWDVSGQWRDVPAETLAAVFAALGAGPEGPPPQAPLVTAGTDGRWPELPAGTLLLEQGGVVELGPGEPPPPDLPFGYHHFEPVGAGKGDGARAGAGPLTVAVCPQRCPFPSPGRKWGWSAQLYATRSTESWGMGDFGDLARLVDWAVRNGATFVLSNPLHATALRPVPEPSPYSPSSRCFLNPLYIKVEDVPGAADHPVVAKLAGKARALNADRLIDRPAVWALKSEALEALFAASDGGGAPAAAGTSMPTSPSAGKRSMVSPHFAPWLNNTANHGNAGQPSTTGPTGPRWPGSRPTTRPGPVSAITLGCSGFATLNWITHPEGIG